jgi:hypothetical protein
MKNESLCYASFLAAQIATGNAFIAMMPTEHIIPQHFTFENRVFSSVTTSDNTDRLLVLDTVGNALVPTPTELKLPQHSSSFESRIFSSVMTRNTNSDMELLEAVLRVEKAAPRRSATRTRASAHKMERIFSPAVYAAKMLLGDNRLSNEVRAKANSLQSGLIGSFLQIANNDVGNRVLTQMDVDRDGSLCEKELAGCGRREANQENFGSS